MLPPTPFATAAGWGWPLPAHYDKATPRLRRPCPKGEPADMSWRTTRQAELKQQCGVPDLHGTDNGPSCASKHSQAFGWVDQPQVE
jgi:hypothetical protein